MNDGHLNHGIYQLPIGHPEDISNCMLKFKLKIEKYLNYLTIFNCNFLSNLKPLLVEYLKTVDHYNFIQKDSYV